ncbi:hypothetical protein K504DRAFT_492206 [Pleomassaria siparia CBS 279.74]|uniref:Uncharacterized protein n=1 Tax=Pleomassaria siparia CBS 279.74 TaxID=1314801 RepID=A0A6G1K4S3_9PLEO|nr:hypothetical protein K504DRAFT_492206 [Pleomassaria siparia CBS 279.74]
MSTVAPGQDLQRQQQQQQDHHYHHQQSQHSTAPHGKKRAADNGLENEQRLSKRFDLLNIDNGTRLYIPMAGTSSSAATSKHVPKPTTSTPIPMVPVTQSKRPRAPRPPQEDDGMEVEDTPYRVYIHDLAAELSDLESDEENPIFLSDIDKHIAKIPKHVLMGPEPKPTKDNQLILYNVPSSLTVPEEYDSVRKAIAEARARVREKQGQPAQEPARANGMHARGPCPPSMEALDVDKDEDEDEDAMDID